MANSDEIAGWAVGRFLDEWSRHPLSLAIVILFTNLALAFMLFHNQIDSTSRMLVVGGTYVFSFLILLIILGVLWLKPEALYNALEFQKNDLKWHASVLLKTLSDIQLGIGHPYEELLNWLCPSRDPQAITNRTRADVQIVEYLTFVLDQNQHSFKLNDATNFALAKFYYKERQFGKALEKIRKIKDTSSEKFSPGEVEFCTGLILYSLNRNGESRQCFEEAAGAGYQNARCWRCITFLESNQPGVEDFIEIADNCENSSVTENCLNFYSTAFYKKAKLFWKYEDDRLKYLEKAICVAEEAMTRHDSWVAYTIYACCISLKASYSSQRGVPLSADKMEETKKQIFHSLDKALQRRPAVLRYILREGDLEWVQQFYEKDFNELIGREYLRHGSTLFPAPI